MKRDELMEQFAYLVDYHGVPEDVYEAIYGKSRNKYKKRRLNKDHRISRFFEYRQSEPMMPYVAFAIVCNLDPQAASHVQVLEMLFITGYKDMDHYIHTNVAMRKNCVRDHKTLQSVFVLTRAIGDALLEDRYIPKLRKLVDYMTDQRLIELTEEGKEEARTFIQEHAEHCLKLCIIGVENEEMANQAYEEGEKISEERDRIIMEFGRIGVPAPIVQLKPINPFTATQQEKDAWIARTLSFMPADLRNGIKRCDDRLREIDDLVRQASEYSDDLKDKLFEKQKEYLSVDYLPMVAEGFLQMLLEGDDLHKMSLGILIYENFISQSNFPLHAARLPELDDDAKWDDVLDDLNGSLGLKIYNEFDLITLPMSYGEEFMDFNATLPSILARYGDHTLPPHMYLRKSHIKLFREAGYSERRARDFAVILATLRWGGAEERRNEIFFDGYEVGTGKEKIERRPERKDRIEWQEQDAGGKTTEDAGSIEYARVLAAEEERDRAVEERDKAEAVLREARRENKACRHEISILQQEIERLRMQLEEKATVGEVAEREAIEEEVQTKISYPYKTKKKVVVFGGFDIFHRELKKLLPNVRILELSAQLDISAARNADIVFIQTNRTGHSGYWAVRDACKSAGVPCFHMSYASAKRCADFMVGEMEKI